MDILLKATADIPAHAFTVLMCIFALEIWGYAIVGARILELKLNKFGAVGCLILIIGNFFVLQCMMDLQPNKGGSTVITRIFGRIPFGLLAAITVVTFVILMLIIKSTIIIVKNSVSTESIKAGFDNLPLGLAFYLENGLVRMVNKEMIEITKLLTGDNLTDGKRFKKQIMEANVNAELVEAGEQPVFKLEDGRYVSFAFSEVSFENKTAIKITETDITERYLLNLQLEGENKLKESANKRLMELNKTIRDVTIQKEELEAKIKIHDNLGQAGVVTMKYLNGEPNEEERKKLHELWKNNLNFLTHQEEKPTNDVIGDIIETGANVGVAINISGEIPDNESFRYILSKALHECLTNTIRHGQGDRMDVIIEHHGDHGHIKISNNGNPPVGEVKATGGLGTLRDIVATVGGGMTIKSAPGFELLIKIPIGD